ncbi:MAG: copper-translocating P-type ATPase [Paracoccaceae bacterium]|nr:copper-translocating P-type ATPase [Paracoccaceae bacterium]
MNDARKITLAINGMNCASCVSRIEKAALSVLQTNDVHVNLVDKTLKIAVVNDIQIPEIIKKLDEIGYPAATQTKTMNVTGLSCASCVKRLETALVKVQGVEKVNVNLASESVRLTFIQGAVSVEHLKDVAKTTGYPLTVSADAAEQDVLKQSEQSKLQRDTWVAAILALPVVIIEMGGHIFPPIHHLVKQTIGHEGSVLVQFLLTSFILIGPGRQFFTKGVPSLIKGHPDMNALVAIGTGVAFLFSIIAGFFPTALPIGTANIYFEPAVVIIVLILIGRLAEARAKGRTGEAIRQLIALSPKSALVKRGEIFEETLIEDLVIGDELRLLPGQSVAVDGIVISGESYIDESMITGEAIPAKRSTDDTLIGGTFNGNGTLVYRATQVGSDTILAKIIKMVEQAQGAKLPIQALVDKVTEKFVPAVMLIAALTVALWLMLGPDPALGHALVAGVSVLIIACPCAMGLATPTSIIVGTGRAAQLGVLFRKGAALQSLQSCNTVIFDKTGTLTLGHPVLTDIEVANGFDRDTILSIAASIETTSEHPIGKAIVTAAKQQNLPISDVTKFQTITGKGIKATLNRTKVLVGTEKFLTQETIDTSYFSETIISLAKAAKTPVLIAIDGKIAALLAVADPLKSTSGATIKTLHNMGLKVAMLSGDHQDTANAIAQNLGIDHAVGHLMPHDKLDVIREMQAAGETVAFVGDGINDAPALAAADVGIAVGKGSDIAIEAADVILTNGDLATILNAFRISAKTMGNIRQNLVWAFGYNALLIPVAAGIFYPVFGLMLSPILAAGAMAFSSVFVLSNALRLKWVAPHQTKETIK